MSKIVLQNIAEHFGLSGAQVSRALTNKCGVNLLLRRKIIAFAYLSGYRNENNAHFTRAAILFRNRGDDAALQLRKLRINLKRKFDIVIHLHPESINFLSDYFVDAVFCFGLDVETRAFLKSKLQNHRQGIFSVDAVTGKISPD